MYRDMELVLSMLGRFTALWTTSERGNAAQRLVRETKSARIAALPVRGNNVFDVLDPKSFLRMPTVEYDEQRPVFGSWQPNRH